MTSHSDITIKQGKVHLELDAIWSADTQNEVFRLLMRAMSRPGTVHSAKALLKNSKSDAVTAVLATLSDAHVTACNFNSLISDTDWLLAQCQTSTGELADYVVCDGSQSCSITPKIGSLASPEESATAILMVDEFAGGVSKSAHVQMRVTGPGVKGSLTISVNGLDPSWVNGHQDWNSQFPLGVDLLLVSRFSLVALPRTAQLEVLK
jgi:alpha-D-ribose 1-methylphosphonate 5-triphosphate synthase subunit PhnH